MLNYDMSLPFSGLFPSHEKLLFVVVAFCHRSHSICSLFLSLSRPNFGVFFCSFRHSFLLSFLKYYTSLSHPSLYFYGRSFTLPLSPIAFCLSLSLSLSNCLSHVLSLSYPSLIDRWRIGIRRKRTASRNNDFGRSSPFSTHFFCRDSNFRPRTQRRRRDIRPERGERRRDGSSFRRAKRFGYFLQAKTIKRREEKGKRKNKKRIAKTTHTAEKGSVNNQKHKTEKKKKRKEYMKEN